MKKSLKKVVALVSLVMCASCTMITPLNASATSTYLQGDVNGDGSVNVSDTQSARQFLQGMKGADGSTAERLDADRNGIIDENDVNLIRNIVLHLTNGGTISSSNTVALPSHSTKYYNEYNASNGVQIGSTYAVNDVDDISTASTRMIIDDGKDRVRDYSKSGVVKLNYYKNGVSKVATGFVVGEHTILTAAHCLFETSNNAPVLQLTYTLYNSDGTTKGTYQASSYHVPTEYINTSSYESNGYKYDYGLIEVSQDLSDYMIFDLGVARNYITTTNPTLKVTGYSGDLDLPLYGLMVTGFGNLSSSKINNNNIYYDVDTVGGTSGGPLYVEYDTDNDGVIDIMTVIGINSGENLDNSFNLAKRIDTNVLNFVYNNSRIS